MPYVNAAKAAAIVRDAGGRVVGRTRLQKIAYLLSIVGLEEGFPFVYKHYGPYSEELAASAREADLLGLLAESEQLASWGGMYSTYSVAEQAGADVPPARRRLATDAAAADAVELELAATAVFLALEGYADPWTETIRRKPEKAENGRINKAKELYRRLSAIDTPSPWPQIV
jgi:uncharacterized protein YwgA